METAKKSTVITEKQVSSELCLAKTPWVVCFFNMKVISLAAYNIAEGANQKGLDVIPLALLRNCPQ